MFPALHASTLASPLVSPAWSSLAWADGGMGVCTRRGRCPQTSIIEAATNQVLLVASSVILSPNYWLWLKAGWRAYLWTSECASVSPPLPPPTFFIHSILLSYAPSLHLGQASNVKTSTTGNDTRPAR